MKRICLAILLFVFVIIWIFCAGAEEDSITGIWYAPEHLYECSYIEFPDLNHIVIYKSMMNPSIHPCRIDDTSISLLDENTGEILGEIFTITDGNLIMAAGDINPQFQRYTPPELKVQQKYLVGQWYMLWKRDQDGNVTAYSNERCIVEFYDNGQLHYEMRNDPDRQGDMDYSINGTELLINGNPTPYQLSADRLLLEYEGNEYCLYCLFDLPGIVEADTTQNEIIAMIDHIGEITDGIEQELANLGITNIYSEKAREAARIYLEGREDVLSIAYAESGLIFLTSDGTTGGFALDNYEPGYTGTSPSEAFEMYRDGRLGSNYSLDRLVIPAGIPTNDHVKLLVFDTADVTMQWIQTFDTALLNDYVNNPAHFEVLNGMNAIHAMQDGRYADCGLLILAAHGTNINGQVTFKQPYFFSSESITFFDIGTYAKEDLPSFVGTPNDLAISIREDQFDLTRTAYIFCSKGNGRYSVHIGSELLERWIKDYSFDNTVVLLAMCYSNKDPDLWGFFLNHGASAVLAEEEEGSIFQHFASLFAFTRQMEFVPDGQGNIGVEKPFVPFSIQKIKNLLDDNEYRFYTGRYADILYDNPDPDDTDSLERKIASSHWTQITTVNGRPRGPLVLHTAGESPVYLTGHGMLRGEVRLGSEADAEAARSEGVALPGIPGAKVTLYHWLNHTFTPVYGDGQIAVSLHENSSSEDPYTVGLSETAACIVNDDGDFDIYNLPYGIYGITTEWNNKIVWTVIEFREDTPIVSLCLNPVEIAGIVIGADYNPNLGHDYSGYILDADEHLILRSDGYPSTFIIPTYEWYDMSSDSLRVRILQTGNQSLFLEAATDFVCWYEQLELNNENELIIVRSVEINPYANRTVCYINKEVNYSSSYQILNPQELNSFFSAIDVDFDSEVTVTNKFEYSSFTYPWASPGTEGTASIVFDSTKDAYGPLQMSSDEIIDLYYQAANVRGTAESAADESLSPADILLSGMRDILPELEVTATHKLEDTWEEIYKTPEGHILRITVYTDTGRIKEISYNDAFEYHLLLDDPRMKALTTAMRGLLDIVTNTEIFDLSAEDKNLIRQMPDAFSSQTPEIDEIGNQDAKCLLDLDHLSIQIYKHMQVAGNEYILGTIYITCND